MADRENIYVKSIRETFHSQTRVYLLSFVNIFEKIWLQLYSLNSMWNKPELRLPKFWKRMLMMQSLLTSGRNNFLYSFKFHLCRFCCYTTKVKVFVNKMKWIYKCCSRLCKSKVFLSRAISVENVGGFGDKCSTVSESWMNLTFRILFFINFYLHLFVLYLNVVYLMMYFNQNIHATWMSPGQYILEL